MMEEFSFKKPGEVRTRIAPSPTGNLHIGTARAALFNYLFAKKNQGSFILRVEDTDRERSTPEFGKNIVEGLKWLGLDWDEGPDIGGKYGPYRQSERTNLYKKYLEQLLAEDKAYYCFCSEEELEAQRQYQLSQGLAPKYSGKCANLNQEEIKSYLAKGKSPVIRFRVPSKKVSFVDIIREKVEFDTGLLGDLVIAKDLETPLYNFAVVVDDFEMNISHVIRGEDHLSNTPKQIIIQEALGFPQPIFAHLPLILGTDRTKLSKRHGATSLTEFREEGYLPESLINFMAFLGWNPGKEEMSFPSREREIYSLTSLVREFSLDKVQKGGAIFNINKLDFLNGFYLRQKSLDKLTELCLPYFFKANLVVEVNYLKRVIALYQERLKKLSEIVELTDFFFKDKIEYDPELLRWKEEEKEETRKSLKKLEKILFRIKSEDWQKENLEKVLLAEAEKVGDRGKLLWPLRVALTGKKASAGPFEVAEILEKEKVLERVKEAENLLK